MEKGKQTYKLPEGWVEEKLANIDYVNIEQSPLSSTYNIKGQGLPFYQGKTEFGEIHPIPTKF